jgi:hypothetical protein
LVANAGKGAAVLCIGSWVNVVVVAHLD